MKTVLYKDDKYHVEMDESKDLLYVNNKELTLKDYEKKVVELWGAKTDDEPKEQVAGKGNVIYAIIEAYKDRHGFDI
jgi:predicted metal-dependent peptidase